MALYFDVYAVFMFIHRMNPKKHLTCNMPNIQGYFLTHVLL